MKKALFVCLLCQLFTALYSSAAAQRGVFDIAGRDLPPACLLHFMNIDTDKKVIDLASDPCLSIQQPYDKPAIKQALWGYRLSDHSRLYPGMAVYYRYLGDVNRQHMPTKAVLVIWSGGGTGWFSSILFLHDEKNHLTQIDHIQGGDRCLGGISKAYVKQGALYYHQNVTPLMLMTQTPGFANSLSDCAVCCIGELAYRDGNLTGFQFMASEENRINEPTVMRCFKRVAHQYGREQSSFLTPEKLTLFREQVRRTCLERNANPSPSPLKNP